jgi:hypothetical protein
MKYLRYALTVLGTVLLAAVAAYAGRSMSTPGGAQLGRRTRYLPVTNALQTEMSLDRVAEPGRP